MTERGVEVDQMNPLGAGSLPRQCGRERLAIVRLGARLALDEAHRLPTRDIDGRQQLKRRHDSVSNQFSSKCAPASPDFSGWNWVPDTNPSSTAATKRTPCSAVVTRPGASRGAYELSLIHISEPTRRTPIS